MRMHKSSAWGRDDKNKVTHIASFVNTLIVPSTTSSILSSSLSMFVLPLLFIRGKASCFICLSICRRSYSGAQCLTSSTSSASTYGQHWFQSAGKFESFERIGSLVNLFVSWCGLKYSWQFQESGQAEIVTCQHYAFVLFVVKYCLKYYSQMTSSDDSSNERIVKNTVCVLHAL